MLTKMWSQQEEFMRLLVEKRNFPNFPVDVCSKQGQKLLKDTSHYCMDELFEALALLKNSKDHRLTEVSDFNRKLFIEELVDAQHFLFEILIAAGVGVDEFVNAYIEKGEVNVQRIKNGY